MGRLLKIVEEYFTSADLNYRRIPDEPVLALSMSGRNATFQCYVVEHEQQEQITVYTSFPNKVAAELRGEATEYLARANWGMKSGNFELDYGDGEIRYKTFIDIEGGELTVKMVENLFSANVMTADRYYPGLQKVIWGNASPAEAIRQIEGDEVHD